ncbi:MAG: transglutaminase domain-containing protein [Nitrospirae bacterium]|nr:MAG: transglutaminase domain-containing protein [Nitrospirota bacterium]
MTVTLNRAFSLLVLLFWLVTMGFLLQRHYGIFSPSSSPQGNRSSSSGITVASEEQWMGVYLKGEKIGYMSRKLSPSPEGYTLAETFRIRMIVMSTAKDVETVMNARLDPKLRLVSFAAQIKADLDIGISGVVTGKELFLTLDSSGVRTAKKIHLPKEPTLEGSAVTGMLRGLKPGDRLSVPVFDPSLVGIEELELKVLSEERIMSLGKLQEAYKVIGNMKGFEFTLWVNQQGEVLREESPMGFSLVREAKEEALRLTKPSNDLISQAAVPFSLKLPRSTDYLRVRITGIDLKELELDGGRQRLQGNILEITREKIGVEGSGLKPAGEKPEVRKEALDEYLKDTIFIQSTHPMVTGLAKEIVQQEKDPLLAARLIHDWVYRNIEKTPAITLPMAVDVLKTKKGDCNEHTTLFVSLARAAGIPARIAVGLTWKDGFFYYHAWPEFFAGRWIAADPTFGQFPADASHIRLITGDLDRQVLLLSVISRVRLEGLESR